MLSARHGSGVEIDALFGISRAPLLLSTSLLWRDSLSLEDLNSILSSIVRFGIGPVGIGIVLHIEDLLFGSLDPPVLAPVDEREKQLEESPNFIPGLLSGPILLLPGAVFFG